LYADLKRALFI